MKYIATTVVQFPAGVELGLSKEQAAIRGHCIAPNSKRKGWYSTTAPLQFKVGEQFLFDGDMPKAMASMMEPAEKAASKSDQEAKAKAAAEAKARAEAVDAANAAVKAAEAALAEATTDEAKAAASVQLEQARAALAALEG